MAKSVYIFFLFCFFVSSAGYSQPHSNKTQLLFPPGRQEVQLPFERIKDWIVIRGRINGSEEKTFILDTGAPVAVLVNDSNTTALNLTLAGNVLVGGGDANLGKKTPLAKGVQLQFGDIVIENALMVIGAAKDAVSGIDGIIGKYFFEGAVVKIDWQAKQITLYKDGTFQYNGGGMTMPLHLAATGHIYTTLTVSHGDTAASLKTLIDLGNKSAFFINRKNGVHLLLNNKRIDNIITGWGANGPVYGTVTRSTLHLPGMQIDNVVTALRNEEDKLSRDGLVANLGLPVLERFTLFFNYNGKQLIIEKTENAGRPFLFNRSGLILNPRPVEKGYVIAGIIPGSPASAAGIKEGDVLISADGVNIFKINEELIYPLLKGWHKETVSFEFLRSNTSFNVILQMRDLL